MFDLTIFEAGYCTQNEAFTLKGARWKTVEFPALCALLQHPKHGNIVFDTGFAPRSLEVTKSFPFQIYGKMTPIFVEEDRALVALLTQQKQLKATDINTVILSHFHGDHVGGLKDFPQAELMYLDEAYADVRGKKRFSALKKAFIPALMPDDFEERSRPLSWQNAQPITGLEPFTLAIDVFGDQSLWMIRLDGHAIGQIGLYFKAQSYGEVFLVADACFCSQAFREQIPPLALTNHFLSAEPQKYLKTLAQLHQLHHKRPDIAIFPSHCPEVRKAYVVDN
jgi:glyoxylase-like metal-dependent hydrolase (beta-lactamase superfamily II)